MEQVLKVLLVSIITILASLIFMLTLRCKRHPRKNKQVPKAGGSWPIIGHLHLLGTSKLPHKVFGAMADKYGPIFTIQFGAKKAIVVSSSELAKECLLVNDKAASGRPKQIAIELMGYNNAMFGFCPYGNYWRYMRKLVVHKLLSNNRLNKLSQLWDFEVKLLSKRLYEEWSMKKCSENKVLVEFKQLFGDLTMDIIVKMILGNKYVKDCEEGLLLKKVARDCMEYMGSFNIGDAFPYLRWFDLGGHEKAMKKIFKRLDDILQGWLDEHKKRRSLDQIGDQDFMDVMLSNLDDETVKDYNYDADTINKATCLIIILAGVDTTMVALTWALSILLNNPHALQKAKEELSSKVDKDRQVLSSDIPNLIYLQAIFKETLRLYPPGPLMGPRLFIEDCIIGGYHVRTGTQLIVNLYKMFRDPQIWEDPTEFRPERFLTKQRDVDVITGQYFELIPFGSGRRMCPGASLTLQVVHLTLASLLHGFNFSTPLNAPIDMSECFGLTNMKAQPLEVRITPNLASHVYT